MSKHTPGPWDYGWEIQPNGCPTVGHKGLMVCIVAHSAKDPEQRETAFADANLISAAPDLLEALEHCEMRLTAMVGMTDFCANEIQRSIDIARAAISKAKGLTK